MTFYLFAYLIAMFIAGIFHEISPLERFSFTLGYWLTLLLVWLMWAKFKPKIAVHISRI